MDVKDDRFSALYTSHLFNIDPTDPKFKKTKGMEAFITEKASRRQKYDFEKVRYGFIIFTNLFTIIIKLIIFPLVD